MRVHRWILALASRLVPKDARAEWRAEWEAELHHRASALETWRPRRGRLVLVRESSGAFWDALWLQSSRWYSLRLFGRHWRLALSALLSLSIAIAATVMGLSAWNALLFRPPGVGEPATLRFIHVRTSSEPFGAASFPEYAAYRDGARAFSDIAAFPYSISSLPFAAGNVKAQVVATQVSTNFFSVLGIVPQTGSLRFRAPAASDGDEIVGHALWRKLGGDARLFGTTVHLNGKPVRIIGVAPPTFNGMTWGFDPDVWMSLKAPERVMESPPAAVTDRAQQWLHMVGRLRPGVSATQAAADVQLIAAAIERDHPETDKGRSAVFTPLSVTPPGDRGWASMILGALVLIVLLTLVVACANVTNLLLGLSTSRRHEMLVRAALGASRLQLVMPLIRESALLGLVSGVVGYGSAWMTLAKLAAFKPSLGAFLPPVSLDLRPDVVVLAGTLAISLVAGWQSAWVRPSAVRPMACLARSTARSPSRSLGRHVCATCSSSSRWPLRPSCSWVSRSRSTASSTCGTCRWDSPRETSFSSASTSVAAATTSARVRLSTSGCAERCSPRRASRPWPSPATRR